MAEENIKQKAFNGVIWNYINTFGLQILQLVPAMVLSRLLSPSEYGTVAIAAILSGFMGIFISCGFSMALIQKKDLTHIDICSVFYFNIFMSVIIYIFLFFAAPFVSSFFNMPEVTLIMRIASISMVIGAFGAVQDALFGKKLELKTTTLISLSVYTIAAGIAIFLAYSGFSYWALIIQGLVSVTLRVVLYWVFSTWRPTLAFSFSSLKSMFGFGSKILGKSITDYGFGKLYDIVIGKYYSAADLSYFNKANATQSMFVDTFLMVMNSVAFASFSKLQSDFERMKSGVIRFFKVESMIISFVMLLVICLAEPMFHFLYSSKWDAVIPLFRIICIWGLFRPISCVFANGLMAHGDSGMCLVNSIIGRGLNVLFLIFTWKYGTMVMISGQVVAYLIEIFLYTISFNKVFKYTFFDMLKDITPYYLLSGLICLLVFLSDTFIMSNIDNLIPSEFIASMIRLGVGGVLGCGLFLILHKKIQFNAYQDFKDLVTQSLDGKPYIGKFANRIL